MPQHVSGHFVPTRSVTIVAVAALLAPMCLAVASSSAEPATYALPGCYGAGQPPAQRPNQVLFQTCADGSKELTGLRWTAWGPQGADGTGTYSHQVCEPNCAAGHRVSYPALVHADEPVAAGPESGCAANVQFYANLTVAFPEGVPDPADSPINSRYRGSPAVTYSTAAQSNVPTGLAEPRC